MTETTAGARTLVVEHEFAHPAERVWRALTQSELLAEWLMPNNFRPEVGAGFAMTAEWGRVEGEVLAIEPGRSLRYSWKGPGLDSVVEWTLAATSGGTRLRMEQTGFRPEDKMAWHGARTGWPRFLNTLENLLERID